ncbi:IS4 family transposase [Saccharobesus litoralis]|uniref:IS4 family transposase n=1 Tax=Saccharobesus litoralis TaxID=2172099 RepID=UPI00131EEEDC|nr:IS4 family transposase [Saccharobesus litoralis]
MQINNCILAPFYSQSDYKKWNGFRLLSVDGSLLELPPESALYKAYGKLNPQARLPGARLSQLYDPLNQLTLDVQESPYSTGERELAFRHLARVENNDLLLFDRGYQCHWLFSAILQKQAHFCARVTHDFNNQVKAFVGSDKVSSIVNLARSKDKNNEFYRLKSLSCDSIRVRLIKVELSSGEVEILATSLIDDKAYPNALFKALYHLRWDIEEDYKRQKCRIFIENFTGLTPLAIKQDIQAQVVSKNMATLWKLAAQVHVSERNKNCRRDYKVNFSYLLGKFKDNFVKSILGGLNMNAMMKLVEQLSSSTHAFRPERCMERRPKKNCKWQHPMGYKPAF